MNTVVDVKPKLKPTVRIVAAFLFKRLGVIAYIVFVAFAYSFVGLTEEWGTFYRKWILFMIVVISPILGYFLWSDWKWEVKKAQL